MPVHPHLLFASPLAVATLLAFQSCGTGTDTAGSPGSDAPAAKSRIASLDSSCVDAINGYRTTLSLSPLKDWSDSVGCIDRQATRDAAGSVAHANFGMCGEMAQNTCPNWPTDTSFAGEITTLKSCVRQMWNEGPGTDYSIHGHYINMTNTSYTKVGCGFHVQGKSAWIDMDFR